MSTVEKIRLRYPLPLAKLYEAMAPEPESRQRVRKLVDLFERTAQYLVLVISDIPAGKIAGVNRGVLLPLSSLVKDMKFTLEIDVTSEEGVPKATLENKIKGTIRQIGVWLSDERLE
jgi:hypothetical protein